MIFAAAMSFAACKKDVSDVQDEDVEDAATEEDAEENDADEESDSASKLDPSEQKTIDSLKKIADGIYIMDCYTDYKLDDYLAAGITDTEQFDIWMTDNLTHGVPTGDIPDSGCSCFAVTDPAGDHLFARNYDMVKNEESLILRTDPKDGYSSIGIVDLSHINLGKHGEYDIEDEGSRTLLLAAPWCICDGINEKGFGVALLSLNNEHTVKESEKPDLLLYSVLRVALDKCADVDEAVSLLEGYDIYSPGHHTYHVFMTDVSGRAVTVEWTDKGKMTVIEDTAVTNFPLYLDRPSLDGDQRYTKIHRAIDDADPLTSSDAMEILSVVKGDTQWSAVYDLDKYSVDICFNTDYEKTYSYSGTVGTEAEALSAADGGALTEILLTETKAVADEIISFSQKDYDGDGKEEAFAIVGEVVDDEWGEKDIIGGAVWYVNEKGAKKIVDPMGMGIYDSPRTMTLGDIEYMLFDEVYVTSIVTHAWSVENGDAEEAFFSAIGEIVPDMPDADGHFAVMHSAYDCTYEKADDMWLGHSWKNYYFFYDDETGGVKEYGGTEINRETVTSLAGRDLVGELIAAGDTTGEIFCRGNGHIVINYEHEEDGSVEHAHYIYDFLKGEFIDDLGSVTDAEPQPGICEKAICPWKADYPEVPVP